MNFLAEATKRAIRWYYYSKILEPANKVLFSVSEKLTDYRAERKRFASICGYWPNIQKPVSFHEKILVKKLYDRNPLLPIVSDKFRVREYVRSILGEPLASEVLIPLLFHCKTPEEIPYETTILPFVVKVNHGSGQNIFVHNLLTSIEKQKINEKLFMWLRKPHGFYYHEWAYQSIPPMIIGEPFMSNMDGSTIVDYKFFVLHGCVELIMEQLIDNKVIYTCLYDRNFSPLRVEYRAEKIRAIKDPSRRPDNLEKMLAIAEKLADPFDFIRVDLYNVDGKIQFGELTNYPASGTGRFDPFSFDIALGQKWKQKPYK